MGGIVFATLGAHVARSTLSRVPAIPRDSAFGAGCIAAVIAAFLHSLADFNLQIPTNAAILLIIMSIAWRVVTRQTPIQQPYLASKQG